METSTTTPAAEKKAAKQAQQDQKIADAISQAEKLITTAIDNAEALVLLEPRGYGAAALTEALTTWHKPAQEAFNARQTAIGLQLSATAALGTAEAQERKDYADYREIARAAFPAAADRQALGLVGEIPRDLEKFLTTATAGYSAGKKAPYSAKLSERGFTPAAIDAELQGLKGVANFAKAQAIAKGAAQKATETRDAAAKALATWAGEFRKVARRALRTRPDLLAALEL